MVVIATKKDTWYVMPVRLLKTYIFTPVLDDLTSIWLNTAKASNSDIFSLYE